jgi:tetratricopeptide (TPR) repeat protein/pimeloyl-ACP methyl ester carboxylesterase
MHCPPAPVTLRLLILPVVISLGLFATSPSAETSSSRENNTWYLYSNSDIAIVFVHGFLSNSADCWQNPNGAFWPDLVAHDSVFSNADIFLGGYFTSLSSRAYDTVEASKALFDALDRHIDGRPSVLDHPYVFFVAHSIGGIVTRHLLYHNSDRFHDKVLGLTLFASPAYGSSQATRFDGLSKVFGNEMGLQLRPDSPFLKQLDSDFRRLIDRDRIPNLVGMEFVETHFITKTYLATWIENLFGHQFATFVSPIIGGTYGKLVVPRESAVGYFDYRQIPNTDHFNIVKPTDINHPSHIFLRDFYISKFLQQIQKLNEERKVSLAKVADILVVVNNSLMAGAYASAFHQLEDATQSCAVLKDDDCMGQAKFMMAQLQRFREDDDEKAYTLYREAEELFMKVEDWKRLGDVKIKYAEMDGKSGRLDSALQELREAATLYERGNDITGEAGVEVVKADVFFMKGDLDEAESLYNEALESLRDHPDGTYEARSHRGLGRIAFERGEMSKARSLLDTASFDCRRAADWGCRGNVYLAKAEIYGRDGQVERSLTNLQSARAIFETMGRGYDLAVSYMIEGKVLCSTDKERAGEAFERAAGLFESVNSFDLAEKARAERSVLSECPR